MLTRMLLNRKPSLSVLDVAVPLARMSSESTVRLTLGGFGLLSLSMV